MNNNKYIFFYFVYSPVVNLTKNIFLNNSWNS